MHLCGISRNKAANILNNCLLEDKGDIILNNSLLKDKGVLEMNIGANKTHIEAIKEGALGRTYFTDIYSGVNWKVIRKVMKRV